MAEPVAAFAARLEAMEALIDPAVAGGAKSPAQKDLENLAREAAAVTGRAPFDAQPLVRGELRTRVLFIAHGTAEARREVLATCRGLLHRIVPPAGGESAAPGSGTPPRD